MPLLPDSSNEIKLSQIVEEFSPDRKRPWSINEYHRTMNVPRPVPDIPLTNSNTSKRGNKFKRFSWNF